MKVIQGTTDFNIEENTTVAIGKFDGFHRGHKKLLSKLMEQKEDGLKTAVFTFEPSPGAFFNKGNEPLRELNTKEEKRAFLENWGIDYLIEYPFNHETANMPPEEYITEVLVKRLNVACVVAGTDVSYGKRGAGDVNLLKSLSKEYGYEVIIIDKVIYEGREISSTYLREKVKEGNMELVEKLLGEPYHVGGQIVHGRQLGRTIGMPTVNQLPPSDKLLPPHGVYFSDIKIGDRWYHGVSNIGVKPTVSDEPRVGVETYIYDFNNDIYGENIDVYLHKFRRPEMKFEDVDALQKQMHLDMEAGREYHNI